MGEPQSDVSKPFTSGIKSMETTHKPLLVLRSKVVVVGDAHVGKSALVQARISVTCCVAPPYPREPRLRAPPFFFIRRGGPVRLSPLDDVALRTVSLARAARTRARPAHTPARGWWPTSWVVAMAALLYRRRPRCARRARGWSRRSSAAADDVDRVSSASDR